ATFGLMQRSKCASSFNDLVSSGDQCSRYLDTKRLCGFQADRQYEFRRLLDRNIGRRYAVESLADFITVETPIIKPVWRIGQKCLSIFDKLRKPANGG